MPLSINWGTKVIFVPKDYLVPVGNEVYEMNVDQFRKDLKDIEDNDDGMVNEDTHRHNTEVVLSGVTYARTVEIINGYTVEFEDDGTSAGHYTVRLVGANHNIADVKVANSVSIVQANSAGLITVASGSGLSVEQAEMLAALAKIHGLVTGVPLVVTNTSRVAGDVVQTVDDDNGTVTVERQ